LDKIVLRSAAGRERSSVNLENPTKLEQAGEGVTLLQRVTIDREHGRIRRIGDESAAALL
jgi:hypothetical protein